MFNTLRDRAKVYYVPKFQQSGKITKVFANPD